MSMRNGYVYSFMGGIVRAEGYYLPAILLLTIPREN